MNQDFVRDNLYVYLFWVGLTRVLAQLPVFSLFLWFLQLMKGVVHFLKKTFADNLLTPMSSKMSTSFFLQSKRNEGF